MCLTPEAYAERCWGSYQILRTLLEKQKLSDRYEIWSTANETQEEYLQNLLKVYKLLASYAEEHEGNVFCDLHNDKLRHMMADDLSQLEHRFGEIARQFSDLASRVRQLQR
jgi:hypothetical protein